MKRIKNLVHLQYSKRGGELISLLKTDLDLRPVYHKADKACLAHLHLGILAYWVVVTIRYQLKEKGIHHSWK